MGDRAVWGMVKGIDSLLQVEFEEKNDVKEGQNVRVSGEPALEPDG